MATVMDALVTTFSLDTSGFTTGRKKVDEDLKRAQENAHQAAKQIEASGKQAALFFQRLRNEAIGLFAVFAGATGLTQFARNITNTDAAVGRTAATIGMATDELAVWEGVAKRTGGSAEAAAASFQGLSEQLQQWAHGTGGSGVIPFFRALHIDLFNAKGEARSLSDIYMDLARQAPGMSAQKWQFFGRGLNLDQGTINMLRMGPEALGKMQALVRRHGVPSKEDSKRAQDLQNSFFDVQDSVTGLGRVILNDLSPAITGLLTRLSEWIDRNREWLAQKVADEVERFKNWLSQIDWAKVLKGLKDFKDGCTTVIRHLGGIIRVTETLFALWTVGKIVGVLTNIRLLTLGLAAPVAAGSWLAALLRLSALSLPLLLGGDTPQGDPEKDRAARERWNRKNGFGGGENGVSFWKWLFGGASASDALDKMLSAWMTAVQSWMPGHPMGTFGGTGGPVRRSGYRPTAFAGPAPFGQQTAVSGMGAPGRRVSATGQQPIGTRTNNPLNLMAAPGQGCFRTCKPA